MSPSNTPRYVTSHGGPPNGGRAPGMRRYQTSPPPAPPPYTLQPAVKVTEVVHAPAVSIPVCPLPVYASQPSMTVARVTTPVIQAPSERPTVPGETLDGRRVQFDDGSSYLFPRDYTSFHFVSNGHRPWEAPGQVFNFTTYKVPVTTTVRDLITHLGVPVTSTNKLGIAEILEAGGGSWKRGTTFVPINKKHEIAKIREKLGDQYSDDALAGLVPNDRCDETIKEVGWSETAGRTKKPIWLAVYQG